MLAWLTSLLLNRRIRAVADVAERYHAGDFGEPARDYGRDEIGTVATVLDETARDLGARLTEMARERAHMDAILSGMVEGVVLVNSAGRLVLTNPALRSMLRLPPAVADRHFLEVVRHPDIAAQLSKALAGDRPSPVEVPLDRDARRVFVAHAVPVARERGGGAVLVLHDITELRRADQVRRDFVANVSHELRTPLTAIRGYVEALADQPPPEEARRFIEIIARHAMRMERLVRDLLRLARLDAGQETLERVDCNLAALVGAVGHDLESSIEARGQRIDLHLAGDATNVVGRPGQAARRAAQPGREREQLQPRGRHDRDLEPARRPGDRDHRSPTAARASRRAICRGSSSASIASIDRARATRAARARPVDRPASRRAARGHGLGRQP